jgi:hypothetical protein
LEPTRGAGGRKPLGGHVRSQAMTDPQPPDRAGQNESCDY